MQSYETREYLECILYPEFSLLKKEVEKRGITRLNRVLIQLQRFCISLPYLAAPFCMAYGHPIEGVVLAVYGYSRIIGHVVARRPKKLFEYLCNSSKSKGSQLLLPKE